MPVLPILVAAMLLLAGAPAGAGPDPAVRYANATRSGPAAYREGWFGARATRLHYVEAGRGPLVILVHGFPGFWLGWLPQMEALKASHRVVAVDALGAGRSARPATLEPYRIEALAAQLDALARHLSGGERFILVGHDWGAALAFAYAMAHPERLSAVIGISAPPYNQFLDLLAEDPEQQARSTYMQRLRTLPRGDADAAMARRLWQQAYGPLHAKGALSDARMALFGEALAIPGALDGGIDWYRANIPALDTIARHPRYPAPGTRLAVPALLVWGSEEPAFVGSALARTEAIADCLTIARIEGAGHWPGLERPEEVNAAIRAFLGRQPPPPPAAAAAARKSGCPVRAVIPPSATTTDPVM